MGYEFGAGLPRALDAERLRDVLAFAKSQERNFRAALDRAASPAWIRTDPEWMGNGGESDFYARLLALLRSAEGRFAWIEAENIFEGGKKKNAARANVFVRLSESIRDELRQRVAEPPAPVPGNGWVGVIDSVAELLSADRLAELAWALSWPVRDADGLVSAVERHPGIRPGLEEVLTGLVPVNDRDSDKEPESGALLVSLALAALNVESVKADELEALDAAAERLAEIVSMRRAALERPAALLREWRERQADKVEEFKTLASLLAPLERRVEEGRIEDEDMESVLECFDEAIGVEEQIREKRKRLDAAVSKKEYGTVASLGGELETLNEQLEGVYDEIHGEAYWGLDGSTEDRTEIYSPAPAEPVKPPEDAREADEKAADAAADAVEPRDADGQAADAAAGTSAQPEPEDPSPAGRAGDAADGSAPAGDSEAESAAPDIREAAKDEPPPEPAPAAESAPGDTDSGIGAEVVAALAQGRFGLAWHLARAAPGCAPGADAVELVACAHAADGGAFAVTGLSALLDRLDREAKAAPEGAAANAAEHIALVASAALEHGLSPTAGPTAAQLLSTLMPRLASMPSFHALADSVAEVAFSGVHLPRELLRGGDPAAGWREERAALRDETRQWLERERNAKLNFQAATRVWKRTMADWEEDARRVSIGRMIDMLLKEEDGVDRRRIADIARYWRQHGEDEIRRIDREQRTRASTAPIEGRALIDLLGRMAEAANIADRWIDLIAKKPAPGIPFDRKQANLLRGAAREHAKKAIREVLQLESPLAPVAGDAIGRYAAMFDEAAGPGTKRTARPTIGLSGLLNGDLLANPDIEFDDRGRPASDPVDLRYLRPLMGDGGGDFAAAALQRAERGDFRGAGEAVEFARKTGRLNDADGVRAGVERRRIEAGRRLKERIGEVSDRLDAVFARGLIAHEELEVLRSGMPGADSSATDRYGSCMEELAAISDEIDGKEGEERERIAQQLDEIGEVSPEARERIEKALGEGRFAVASHYVELVRAGDELPPETTGPANVFDPFLSGFVDRYAAFRDRVKEPAERLDLVARAVGERGRCEAVDASSLSDEAARGGVAFLDAWTALRERLSDNRQARQQVANLARALGFVGVRVNPGSGNGKRGFSADAELAADYRLSCAPVADRELCKLPDFGSLAAGRYRVIALRGPVTGETVVRYAGERTGEGTEPNIVVFPDVLDAAARRRLARELGSGRYRPTLVLDECLAAFLAASPGDRLAGFFGCAAPFAWSEPYDADAAVPLEMFFGRESERRKILGMDRDLAHFVYGGRRLGKTALLADIAREYEAEAPDFSVLFVSLKGTRIGQDRPAAQLWDEFAEALRRKGVAVGATGRRRTASGGLAEDVTHWLDEKARRRILFLVDEADDFLDADRTGGYEVVEQIERLMDSTERRFKVVFAGLHNVQRAARDPNTPLAHLGDAIRIGPMLPDKADVAAGNPVERLIREPLAALGYRFASSDAIVRIGVETNYYPALVQQFCKELLRHLRMAEEEAEGPPRTVSPETVDRVFDARETRDRIRYMFQLTIQLDPRYEFLTYLIARQSFEGAAAGPQSVTLTDIRDVALREWPEGFRADPSYWTFEVLLEEMESLGILRETEVEQGGRPARAYAIRSRNLRMLIGNDDEVERRFEDAKGKLPPARFEAAQFRSELGGDGLFGAMPSPLTADQWRKLLSRGPGVGMVFGARVGGLERVGEALRGMAVDGEVSVQEAPAGELRAVLARAGRGRKPGVCAVLSDLRGRWDRNAVEDAMAFVAGRNGRSRVVRPIFLCGPAEAWQWLHSGARPRARAGVAVREAWLGPCSRDFARTWLTAREAPAGGCLDANRPVDPPWPAVVAVASDKGVATMADAVDRVAADRALFSDVTFDSFPRAAFRIMGEYEDPIAADELAELSRGGQEGQEDIAISPEDAQRFLEWADRLGLVLMEARPGGGGHGYRLDTTCAKGLRAAVAP